MIIRGQPHCDHCHAPLEALTEEEALDDMEGHGFPWGRAAKHYCFECADKILAELHWPPCEECRTRPCDRQDYCWAEGRFPLHIFPYETYYAERKSQWLEEAIKYNGQKTLEAFL